MTWQAGPVIVVVVVLALAVLFVRRHERELRRIRGQVRPCRRPTPHDGPCNGWPCESARLRMEAADVEDLARAHNGRGQSAL